MNNKFSNRVLEWSVLPTASLHGQILELQQQGESIIDLTIGISNRAIPEAAQEAAKQAIESNQISYTAISGSNNLKKVILSKLAKQNKISVELENIIVTTGAKQAIFEMLYVLTNPGDQVAMITPYWSAYTQIATMLNLESTFLKLTEIPTLSKKKVDPKLKVLLFDLPHNPTGKVFTKAELIEVISFAKQNNLYILADESYEKLVYEGQQISLATVDPDFADHIVTVFSLSQTFSMMGWRIGFAVANPEIIAAMEALQSSITAGTSGLSQVAAAAIIDNESEYISKLVEDFKERRDIIFSKIKQIPWIAADLPASGPYFWCNIQKLTSNSLDFAKQLLAEQKVALMPGEAFGEPGWIRIAFNVQSLDVLEQAIAKIAQFGEKYE